MVVVAGAVVVGSGVGVVDVIGGGAGVVVGVVVAVAVLVVVVVDTVSGRSSIRPSPRLRPISTPDGPAAVVAVPVMSRRHPPASRPLGGPGSPGQSSTTYRFQVPLGSDPFNDPNVLAVAVRGAGAEKVSAGVKTKFSSELSLNGRNVPLEQGVLAGKGVAPRSSRVTSIGEPTGLSPLFDPQSSETSITVWPLGASNITSRSDGELWVNPDRVTLSELSGPVTPDTSIGEG